MRQSAFVPLQVPRIATDFQVNKGFGICATKYVVPNSSHSVRMNMRNTEPSSFFTAFTSLFTNSNATDGNAPGNDPVPIPLEASWVASTFSKPKILDEEFARVFPIPTHPTEVVGRDTPKEAPAKCNVPNLRSPGGTRQKSFLQLCVVLAAFAVNEAAEYGYQHQNKAQAAISLAPTQVNKMMYTGLFSDPKHPLCQRQVELQPDSKSKYQFIVSGEDGSPGCMPGSFKKKWQLPAQYDSQQGAILVDFSPKGGPKDLQGIWDPSRGVIQWADGNIWPKLFRLQ